MKITPKKLLKPYFLIPIILLIMIIVVFVGWQFKPSKILNIAVLDKTVPAASEQSESDISGYQRYYRKHSGFYWILNQQKYALGEKKQAYDYKKDYFGPYIDENGEITSSKELSDIDYQPDMVYLADAYGSELYDNKYKGVSEDDMSVVSLAHSSGATVVAETELFNSTDSDSVKTEIKNLCGISTTGWVGRYVFDLSDFSDVPKWAPPDYEEQYGVEWKFSGPGILLVSSDGTIIVLEEKTDFNSKNLLKISVADDYNDEFGSCSKAYFYNWFELIVPDSATQTIANYDFDLNATGMEKIADISKTSTFAAITRKQSKNEAPVYYFAGDFNDYVQKEKVNKFLFADKIYKLISFNRDGDITNFYWTFYNPLMKQILSTTYKSANHSESNSKVTDTEISKIENGKFNVMIDNKWQEFAIKGYNLNGYEPASSAYSRNYTYYKDLISQVAECGSNCIKVYDLLPPEFYRAVYDYNKSAKNAIYIVQTIKLPALSDEKLISPAGIKQIEQTIDSTLLACHGTGTVSSSDGKTMRYAHNVSNYLLGFVIDTSFSKQTVTFLNKNYSANYNGKFVSGSKKGADAFVAYLSDYLLAKQKSEFNYFSPVGVSENTELLASALWSKKANDATYNPSTLTVSADAQKYFFTTAQLNQTDNALISNLDKFKDYTDDEGKFAFGSYVKYISSQQNSKPFLVDGFGMSTNSYSYGDNKEFNGISETRQGNGIVRMYKAINSARCLGGFIKDFNDNWNACSSKSYPYTVSIKNNPLWHNLTDSAQTTGVVALEAEEPTQVGMEFSDFEVMKKVQLFTNPEYLYITVMLDSEIDFKVNELFFGLDTYQRNDGEYLYNKNFYANSLSGMEFCIRVTDSKTAELLVSSSYDKSSNKFSSKEGYDGKWTKVCDLSYGNFTTTTSQFYVASTNIKFRIPWALLNFTDPTQKLVVNQTSSKINGQLGTTSTNGMIFSMYLANKEDKDTDYIFPISKDATGYKTFKWSKWEKVDYTLKRKASYTTIQSYFNSY